MKKARVKKELKGIVISDKMDKTIIIETKRHVAHPKYRKVMLLKSKLAAHDEKGTAKIGDFVKVASSRPISKTKQWKLVEVLTKAKVKPDERNYRFQKKTVQTEAERTESKS